MMLVLSLVAAYLGHRRWHGWRGALRGVVILWVVYFLFLALVLIPTIFMGDQVQMILETQQ